MRLVELNIVAEAESGWGSGRLLFGDDITQLYGPNGCGKTPVIHSIAFALGYPVRFRDDINEHCASVSLIIKHRGVNAVFNRDFKGRFCIHVRTTNANENKKFYNEQEFSKFLFDFVGVPFPTLTDLKNNPTNAYLATFLPLFYVDQDSGYTLPYKAPSSFIKDQYAEMVRLAIGVPPKHSFDEKKQLLEKKSKLASTDRMIVNKEKLLVQLLEEVSSRYGSTEEIELKLTELKDELEEMRLSRDSFATANSALTNLVFDKRKELQIAQSEINELKQRINDFKKIRNEIDVEIKTLSLNEEAKRLFSAFEDICSKPGCGLFFNSSESYGKSLLYLKDQMKDLDRNTEFQQRNLERLLARTLKLVSEIGGLQERIALEAQNESADVLLEAIGELTGTLIDLQSEKVRLARLEAEQDLYHDLQKDRINLHNDIAALSGGRHEVDLRQLEFKTKYRTKIVEWLDVLSTKNVSRNISYDNDFDLLFGTEKINQFSGSTLLRVILAIKAAFYELYLASDNPTIKFLIFDTPRQHDIEEKHFAAFLDKLKGLVSGAKAQVIFSTTAYHYEVQEGDVEWTPIYPGAEQDMFLGTIAQISAARIRD